MSIYKTKMANYAKLDTDQFMAHNSVQHTDDWCTEYEHIMHKNDFAKLSIGLKKHPAKKKLPFCMLQTPFTPDAMVASCPQRL